MSQSVKAKFNDQQTLLDGLLSNTGSVESLFEFMKLNGINDASFIPSGDYHFPFPPTRESVVNFFKQNGVPATISEGIYEPVIYHPAVSTFMDSIGIPNDPEYYLYRWTPQEITGSDLWLGINTFIWSLVETGVWPKMKVIYPFVGSTSDQHAVNLVSDAYSITWHGAASHSRFGVQFDGSTGYGDTNFSNPNDFPADYDMHMSVYIKNSFPYSFVAGSGHEWYTRFGSMLLMDDTTLYYCANGSTAFTVAQSGCPGYYCLSKSDAVFSSFYKYRPGISPTSYLHGGGLQVDTANIYIGCINGTSGNAPIFFSQVQMSFFTLGAGLSDTDVDNLYNAIQQLQTTLNRNL